MRLRLKASNLAEWLGLRSRRAPLPMGDVWLAIFQARALMAATRLGVFDALAAGARTGAGVAGATGLHADMAEMLLRLLACTPYVVRKSSGAFATTRLCRRFLTRASPLRLVSLMELMYLNLEWFGELEEVLRTGRGVDMHSRLRGEAEWRVYQEAMREAARLQAPLVARHVPLQRGATRLLDIGGSHGLFAAAICRRRPGMRADVLELPSAVAVAQEIARQEGLVELVRYRAADALHDDLGSGYDAVLVSNLLHHFQPVENLDLLSRARAALRPHGTLAVWDLELPSRRPDLVGDCMALLCRVTSGAKVYSAHDHAGWLREAGCVDVRTRRFLAAPGQVLVTGRTAAAPGP